MGVSKVIYGNTPVMDITDSTVTPQNLLSGEVAYSASGNRVVGTAQQNIADGVYAVEKKVYTGPTAISETTYNLTQSVNDYSYIRIDVGINPEHINGTFAISQLKDNAGGIIVLAGSNEWFSFSLNAAGTVLTVNDTQNLGNNREIYGIYAVKFIENNTTGPIEYIESTGTQYIDTGVKATDISKIVVDCSIEDTPGAWGCIFGSQGDYTSGDQSFILTWNNSKFNFRCGTSNNEIPMLSNITLQQRYVFECTNSSGTAGFSVDETSQGTTASSTLSSTLNVWLFKNNANTTVVNQVVSMKLYSCKIYNTSDTLIADYKPYIKNGEACLYDEISNTYLMNIGTGDFIAGPEITPTSAGHTILNNSGTALPAEPNLQLKGVYTHDDSTNEATVVEVTRVMTSEEYALLTDAEKKGVIVIEDESPEQSYTDLVRTLTVGTTSLTISDIRITSTTTPLIWTSSPLVAPTNMVVATGFITLTFEAQQSNVDVLVRLTKSNAERSYDISLKQFVTGKVFSFMSTQYSTIEEVSNGIKMSGGTTANDWTTNSTVGIDLQQYIIPSGLSKINIHFASIETADYAGICIINSDTLFSGTSPYDDILRASRIYQFEDTTGVDLTDYDIEFNCSSLTGRYLYIMCCDGITPNTPEYDNAKNGTFNVIVDGLNFIAGGSE